MPQPLTWRTLCPSPEACCLYLSPDADGVPELEGVSLPWQGWDSPSQSDLPCHSCCAYGNPLYADKHTSG